MEARHQRGEHSARLTCWRWHALKKAPPEGGAHPSRLMPTWALRVLISGKPEIREADVIVRLQYLRLDDVLFLFP